MVLHAKDSDHRTDRVSFDQFFTSLRNGLGLKRDRRRINEGSFGVFRTKPRPRVEAPA